MKVLSILQLLLIACGTPFREVHTANICGHKTHKKGPMYDGKATSVMEMPLAKNGHPDWCLECIGRMSIRCAWCGEPIVIGDPITLGIPIDEFKVPDYAVKYREGEEQALVGCLRWDCADTCAELAGYWWPPGAVRRVTSPLEACLGTGKMVMVGDTRNYPASVSLHDV